MPRAIRSRSLCTAALAAAALAATAFAPASGPTAAAHPLDLPDVRVELTQDGPVRTVAGMADRLGLAPGESLRDPDARQARVRRLLDVRGHTTVRATDGACLERCAEATDGDAVTVGTFGGSFPTADLDGDGTDDVLLLTETYDADADAVHGSVEARSGADGALLWRQEQPGFFAAVPDLDGDGLPDLLSGVWMVGMGEDSGTCAIPLGVSCDGYTVTVDEVLEFTAHAGATGAGLGSVSLTSTYRETYRSTRVPVGWHTGREEFELTIEDGIFGLAFLDVDGDGAHELVHDRSDVTATYDGLATMHDTPFGFGDLVAGRAVEDLAGEVVVVDLAAGTSATVRTDDAAVLLVDSVDAGHGARLLLDRYPELGSSSDACAWIDPLPSGCVGDNDVPGAAAPSAPTRTMHDEALEPVWEVGLDPSSLVLLPAGGDLDGDGAGDLVDLRFDDDAFEDVVVAVGGATGEDLWRAPVTVATLAGDVMVAAVARFPFGDDGIERVEVDAARLEPATGVVIDAASVARASVAVPQEEDTMTIAMVGVGLLPLVGDDADVLAEAYVAVGEFSWDCEVEEDPETGETTEHCSDGPEELMAESYELAGVDGRDLAPLFRREDPRTGLLDVVDLDDDGAAELVTAGQDGVRAERADGSLLWVLPDQMGLAGLLATPAGPDVLVDEPGRTAVRDGDDLTLRWAVPS